MEKDILTYMEALTTQASDAFSAAAPSGHPPAIQTLLEDASLPASSGGDEGQKSTGQRQNDELEERSVINLFPNAKVDALRPRVTPIHAASPGANSRKNVGKKNSRKRRNRKEKKLLYIPWPLMLQTRASSAAPVLGLSCVVEALSVANTEVDVGHERRMQMGNREKERVSILTKTCMAPASVLWPAASPVRPFPEGAFLASNEEIKVELKSSHKKRNQKDKKTVSSPWPLTVQAWASFTGPAKVQIPFPRASPSVINEVYVEHINQSQKCEMNKSFIVTSYQSTQDGVIRSTVALGQASLEDAPLTVNSERNIGGKGRWNSKNKKEKSDLAGPWPLTVQAWVSFTTTDPVQTFFQGMSSAASTAVNVKKNTRPQQENSEKETKSILPLCVMVQAGTPLSTTALRQASFEGVPSLGRHIFQENKQMKRARKRQPHGGHVERESHNVEGAEESGSSSVKMPECAATGKEIQEPLTGAEQNTKNCAAVGKD